LQWRMMKALRLLEFTDRRALERELGICGSA
jgi:hypothetical protein